MRLDHILQNMNGLQWDQHYADLTIDMISCDSREEQPRSLFVALDGFKCKGEDFIKQAVSHGAVAVVKTSAQRRMGDYEIPDHIAVIACDDPKLFLRQAALIFYGNPSRQISVIGVTGTNGKTTVTYLLEAILQENGQNSAVVGTINYRIGKKVLPSKNTTPGFLDMQRFLAQLSMAQVPSCIMEVSSHALDQGRVDGIDFQAAIFTNLTQDHLDYHKDMERYFLAKSLLFSRLSGGAHALINTDDAYGPRMVALSKGKVLTYGIERQAGVMACDIAYALTGTDFNLEYPAGRIPIHTALVGQHNVYNILSAASCAYAMGISLSVIAQAIRAFTHVPGRLESVQACKDIHVFIDYAHTPDGLINVLQALRQVSHCPITVVFGCGGDRDRGKRPLMGKAACDLADHAIITSDNPRSEDPMSIINEVKAGFNKNNFEVCVDRRDAIHKALARAPKGSIVLLAGKGHEDYQVLKDKTIPFNERHIVEEYIHVHHQ